MDILIKIERHSYFSSQLFIIIAMLCYFALTVVSVTSAANISEVPFWDGETTDPSGPFLNRFGGNPVLGTPITIEHSSTTTHTGKGSFRIDTNNIIPAGQYNYFATSLTGFGNTPQYVDTRDISNFKEIQFFIRNATGSRFFLTFEIKDYRDSNDHRARYTFTVSSDGSNWQAFSVPIQDLTPSNGWTVIGNPDLSRTKLFAFAIEAYLGEDVSGSIYLDDMILIEKGGSLESQTAPISELIERILKRQFLGLWGSRDRNTGLVPSISSYVDVLAINTTAALIYVLPTAINQSWVEENEVNTYIDQVVITINSLIDNAQAKNAGFLPPRYVDRVTLEPTNRLEESSIDGAFLFLALYKYKILPNIPIDLKTDIDDVLERFDFNSFVSLSGWKMAYLYDQNDFTSTTYDGYSGEVWVISLAAHLQANSSYHVDIATLYHSATHRVLDYLVDSNRQHLVHEYDQFRAPFLQWLFPLFVDVSNRGKDTYPDSSLASNPYDNVVLYQTEVHNKLTQLGRARFLQPDAGDDGTGNTYEQFSCYNDFGQPNLFMPWSIGFSFLADPSAAEVAFRSHLSERLHGPLGLSDSVQWATNDNQPSFVSARHDFWDLSLSTMAFMQHLYGSNQVLASNNDVRKALDTVFTPKETSTFQWNLFLPAILKKGNR